MMSFKTFWSATKIIAGIETRHMIKKGNSAAPEVGLFHRPTTSTAWQPRRFLDGHARPRLATLIATEPAKGVYGKAILRTAKLLTLWLPPGPAGSTGHCADRGRRAADETGVGGTHRVHGGAASRPFFQPSLSRRRESAACGQP
jgi:hypothetical protein